MASEPALLEAKAPGVRHCYKGVCHRVRTVDETRLLLGSTLVISTSHYDFPHIDRFNIGTFTSNGERFHAGDPDRVSSSDLPDGTELLLRNPDNGRVSHVRVNDFGPFHGERLLDVTRRVADDLGFSKRGVTDLEVTIIAIPRADDLVYRRNRSRLSARGHLGVVAEADMPALISRKIAERSPGDTPRIIVAAPLRPTITPIAPAGATTATEIATITGFETAAATLSDATYATFQSMPGLWTNEWSAATTAASARLAEADAPVSPADAALTAEPSTLVEDVGFDMAAATPVELDTLEFHHLPFIEPALFAVATVAHHDAPSLAAARGDGFFQAGTTAGPFSKTGLPTLVLLVLSMTLLSGLMVASAWREAPPYDQARQARTSLRRADAEPLDQVTAPPRQTVERQPPPPIPVIGPSRLPRLAGTGVPHAVAPVDQRATPQVEAQAPVKTSLIGAEIFLDGNVSGCGRLAVAGRVIGKIDAGVVIILDGGIVKGDISADEVEIDGTFEGAINARLVRVKSAGLVTGRITCDLIEIIEGARVEADVSRRPAAAASGRPA